MDPCEPMNATQTVTIAQAKTQDPGVCKAAVHTAPHSLHHVRLFIETEHL